MISDEQNDLLFLRPLVIEKFETREIFYHPEIIDPKHRAVCYVYETAVFLINELAHTGEF